ncbi:hypothetical protein JZ751_019284 [Albula glossodonta]|uniref:Uncharacterized protein n=1 Tax=Albula glossodonta TaxID=121402 RepID=A0A8T2NN44_9TELE|nr:hypothetical protein JZ751_019284 [Albula glossodonta]
MSEKPYRGSNGNKPRQPNVVGKRYGLLSTQCIFDELMQELSREVATETFQKSKRDFVDAYLAEVAVRRCRSDIISEVVQLLLPGLVEEALREKAVDDVIEVDLLPEVIAAEARAVALSELVEQSALTAAQQFTQVRHYASNRLLDGYLLEHLVKLVASGGRCFTERELSGRLLDSAYPLLRLTGSLQGWMLDVLSHRLLHVMHFRNLTVENIPLRTFHRRVFTDIALDVILSELTESLDEDMEQLLEYERLMEEDTG